MDLLQSNQRSCESVLADSEIKPSSAGERQLEAAAAARRIWPAGTLQNLSYPEKTTTGGTPTQTALQCVQKLNYSAEMNI